MHAFVLAVAVYAIVAVFSALEQVIPGRMYPLFSLLPVCAVPLLLPPLFELSNAVSCAFELPRNARYVRRASKKLKKARENGCIVIGITGSYGKTSVKNMLAAILGEKYRVCATPESYNTPLGIAKTLESKEFDGAEVFIAEMGAAKTGDIKELCDLFPVDYGVFTGVCRQHSETFGGLEEIFAEKKILIDRAEKKAICGAEVYADFGDKLSAEEMKKCVFVPAGAVSDVGGFPLQTSFDLSLNVGGKVEKRRVEMPVLGRGAAENAALAAYAAAEAGLSADEIFKGLALAKPVPHRLQLLEENGVHVLSNTYVMLERGGDRIALLGAEDSNGYADQKTIAELSEEVRQEQGDVYKILLSHRNTRIEEYVDAHIDLTLCGHAHGGLIRLPGTDGLIGPHREFFPSYTAGLYDLPYGQLVASRGLGNQFPAFRLFNRPDVPVVVLE